MFWKILQYWDRRKSRQHWTIFIVAILGFTAVLSMFNGLGKLDRLFTDTAARLDLRTPSPEIVIIVIDDDSINDLGQWPLPRSIHAEVLDKLKGAGALVIGMDIIMDKPDRLGAAEDLALADAINMNSPVVLPAFTSTVLGGSGWKEMTLPTPVLAENAAIGHINIETDTDGVARNVYLREGRDGVGGGVWYHFAAVVWLEGRKQLSLSTPEDVEQTYANALRGVRAPADILRTFESIETAGLDTRVMSDAWLRDQWVLIPYAGGPGSFQRYSYRDIYFDLELLPKDALRGKYVLIGVTGQGLGDMYATPVAGKDALMYGVEINANVLDGILQNEYRYEASPWQNTIYNMLLVALIIPLFYLGRPRGVLIGVMCLMPLSLILMFLLRRYVGIQFAPAASLITLSLAYPLWSWRRLEQAMRQIRMEFSRMRRENGFFQAPEHVAGDRLERDLQEFENASWQLRDLQQMVRQSMDALPYILLLTDERAQVMLSNMQARRFFRVDPPLPTMAFEPAMGTHTEDSTLQEVQAHELISLLGSRFLGSLLSQESGSNYARDLVAYLRHQTPLLTEGSVEVIDAHKGETYLLKIIPRIATIERSQGWIVTLINLSGAHLAELQRDQILRYLQERISPKLLSLQEEPAHGIAPLKKEVDLYLDFQYAQTAIYYYEKLDLRDILKQAYTDVADENPNIKHSDAQQLTGEAITIQGDAQMLHKGITALMALMVSVSRGDKMPQIRVSEQIPDESTPDAVQRTQVFLLIALKDPEYAAAKEEMFTINIQQTAIPDELDPDALSWWAVKAIINRHSGTIKAQKNQHSLGITVEILK